MINAALVLLILVLGLVAPATAAELDTFMASADGRALFNAPLFMLHKVK